MSLCQCSFIPDVIQYFMCYYFGCYQKMWREHERKCEATPTACCRYHQKTKQKLKNLWLKLICCCLLNFQPASFILPLTVYMHIFFPGNHSRAVSRPICSCHKVKGKTHVLFPSVFLIFFSSFLTNHFKKYAYVNCNDQC